VGEGTNADGRKHRHVDATSLHPLESGENMPEYELKLFMLSFYLRKPSDDKTFP